MPEPIKTVEQLTKEVLSLSFKIDGAQVNLVDAMVNTSLAPKFTKKLRIEAHPSQAKHLADRDTWDKVFREMTHKLDAAFSEPQAEMKTFQIERTYHATNGDINRSGTNTIDLPILLFTGKSISFLKEHYGLSDEEYKAAEKNYIEQIKQLCVVIFNIANVDDIAPFNPFSIFSIETAFDRELQLLLGVPAEELAPQLAHLRKQNHIRYSNFDDDRNNHAQATVKFIKYCFDRLHEKNSFYQVFIENMKQHKEGNSFGVIINKAVASLLRNVVKSIIALSVAVVDLELYISALFLLCMIDIEFFSVGLAIICANPLVATAAFLPWAAFIACLVDPTYSEAFDHYILKPLSDGIDKIFESLFGVRFCALDISEHAKKPKTTDTLPTFFTPPKPIETLLITYPDQSPSA